MKIALCQMAMDKDCHKNMEKSYQALKEAAENGADIIFYPEIQLAPFFPQYEGKEADVYAMKIDDPFVSKMQNLCLEYGVMAAPNIYLEENGKYYDATLLIGADGKILAVQKMVHIAQAECFYEQDYYAPADDGFKVTDTPFGKIGIVICFDRHYPESIRTEALMDADLILIPTANTKDEPMEMFEWEIRVQAFQNSVAVAMCNRVGCEDKMNFSGESLVGAANGELILKADDAEGIFYAEIEPEMSGKVRRSRPYTDLRRKEFYS